MKDSLYTLFYSALLGTLCAVLLTATSLQCKPLQEANERAEVFRNKLVVLGIEFDKKDNAETIETLYGDNVLEEETEGLQMFRYPKEGAAKSVGVPIEGPGLWGPVYGFISLESDLNTIQAISFYKQEETPGLGGEIGSAGFQKQFKGKTINGLHFVRNKKAENADEIDAITGATLTCDKVQKMIDDLAAKLKTARSGK